MTFSAVVPAGGLAGWAFLKRTMERQQAVQQAQPQAQRDEAYFREKIGQISSAEELVSDRRLLRIALGAYGLDGDINNRFFIRKVLEDGTQRGDALANRLANKAYRDFSAAFGFGTDSAPNTRAGDFADRILGRYEARQFEIAVGERSESLRLALNAERELPELAARQSSVDTKWFTVLGSAPLREVFQTAFGLPRSFAGIDLDQQLGVIKDRSERLLGSSDPAVLSDPVVLDRLLRRFLVLSGDDATLAARPGGSAALQILQAGGRGASGLLGILS